MSDANDRRILFDALVRVFNIGDQDECSWKHLGHGIAALLAFDDWREAVDYHYPFDDREPTFGDLKALLNAWSPVEALILIRGKQWLLDQLPILQEKDWRMMYLDTYIHWDWLGYGDAVRSQGLEIRKEI